MSYTINGQQQLSNKQLYIFIEKHRSYKYKKASKWIITLANEFSMADQSINFNFVEAINKNGSTNYQSFNVIRTNNKIQNVGISKEGNVLIIGKFVNTSPNLWHGYPADYLKNIQDKPSQKTLKSMLNKNMLDASEISKIARGKRI